MKLMFKTILLLMIICMGNFVSSISLVRTRRKRRIKRRKMQKSFTSFLKTISSFLKKKFESLENAFKKFSGGIRKFLKSIYNKVEKLYSKFKNALMQVVRSFFAAFIEGYCPNLVKLYQAFDESTLGECLKGAQEFKESGEDSEENNPNNISLEVIKEEVDENSFEIDITKADAQKFAREKITNLESEILGVLYHDKKCTNIREKSNDHVIFNKSNSLETILIELQLSTCEQLLLNIHYRKKQLTAINNKIQATLEEMNGISNLKNDEMKELKFPNKVNKIESSEIDSSENADENSIYKNDLGHHNYLKLIKIVENWIPLEDLEDYENRKEMTLSEVSEHFFLGAHTALYVQNFHCPDFNKIKNSLQSEKTMENIIGQVNSSTVPAFLLVNGEFTIYEACEGIYNYREYIYELQQIQIENNQYIELYQTIYETPNTLLMVNAEQQHDFKIILGFGFTNDEIMASNVNLATTNQSNISNNKNAEYESNYIAKLTELYKIYTNDLKKKTEEEKINIKESISKTETNSSTENTVEKKKDGFITTIKNIAKKIINFIKSMGTCLSQLLGKFADRIKEFVGKKKEDILSSITISNQKDNAKTATKLVAKLGKVGNSVFDKLKGSVFNTLIASIGNTTGLIFPIVLYAIGVGIKNIYQKYKKRLDHKNKLAKQGINKGKEIAEEKMEGFMESQQEETTGIIGEAMGIIAAEVLKYVVPIIGCS